MIENHRSFPCVVMYVVFNEGWGQYEARTHSPKTQACGGVVVRLLILGCIQYSQGVHHLQTTCNQPRKAAHKSLVIAQAGITCNQQGQTCSHVAVSGAAGWHHKLVGDFPVMLFLLSILSAT